MSAIAAGIDPLPDGTEQLPPTVIARKRRWFRRLPGKAKVGAAILAVFILVAIIGPTIAPFDPTATTPGQALPLGAERHPPARHHRHRPGRALPAARRHALDGRARAAHRSDRDVLSVVIGMSAGFLGGASDEGLSLLANVFLVLPALPLLVVILGYLPHSGELPTAIVLSALGWPWGARVIRAQTLSLRNRDYVAAARESGERTWRIILFEIFPNEIGLIAASFVGTVLYAILTSVALAFLGVADLSKWSFGTMLYWAQNGNAVQLNAWWWYAPPGICVALLGMSLVLLNFGLDELGNPRLRAAGRAADRAPHVAAVRPDAGPARSATGDSVSAVTEPGARPHRRGGRRDTRARARHPRPVDRLSIGRRRRPRGARRVARAGAGRGRRPRRRERLRQVDARVRVDPAAAPAGGDHRRQRHLPRPPRRPGGVDVLAAKPGQLRALRWREIAIVFQSAMNSLNPVLRVSDQLLDAVGAHLQLTDEQRHDRIVELIEMVGIPARG